MKSIEQGVIHSKGSVVCIHRYNESRSPTLVNSVNVTTSRTYLKDRCTVTGRKCPRYNDNEKTCLMIR